MRLDRCTRYGREQDPLADFRRHGGERRRHCCETCWASATGSLSRSTKHSAGIARSRSRKKRLDTYGSEDKKNGKVVLNWGIRTFLSLAGSVGAVLLERKISSGQRC